MALAAFVLLIAAGVPERADAQAEMAQWLYVFDRFYFQGDGYSDRRKDRFDVEAGPFVGIRNGVRWWPAGGP